LNKDDAMKKKGARILVVDGEREIVRLLQRTLTAQDFTEYALLKVLITNRDTILSRQVLLGQVWGQAIPVQNCSLQQRIFN
jgi:DNA-binding response OmpR family regulator